MDFSKEYAAIQNAVIKIYCGDLNSTGQLDAKSVGSGVIIGNGQYALTCNHCVSAGTSIIGCQSGKAGGPFAKIIHYDVDLDIAVLDFNGYAGKPAILKNADDIKVGNEAFAVGYPVSSNTITLLSAHIAGFENINGVLYFKIDSSVNHGNSGGPLLNTDGEVIGIINAKKGSLSQVLTDLENYDTQGNSAVLLGVNPIAALQQIIKEMKINLNLGIGNAIPTSEIGNKIPFIKNLLIP